MSVSDEEIDRSGGGEGRGTMGARMRRLAPLPLADADEEEAHALVRSDAEALCVCGRLEEA